MEYQKIEECIEKKNELFKVDEKEVMQYANRVEEANKEAIFVSSPFAKWLFVLDDGAASCTSNMLAIKTLWERRSL